jgi:hypothetical protein
MSLKKRYTAPLLIFSGLLIMPNMAQAKDIENYEDYRLYCGAAAYQYGVQSSDCDKFKSTYGEIERQERYNQSTNQPINQSTNQPINQSTNQPINQSTNQPINQSTNQPRR